MAGAGHRVDIPIDHNLIAVPTAPPGGAPIYQPQQSAVFIDGPDAFDSICRELAQEPVLALDVETTLDTHALCLIQLGTPNRVVIIDPLALHTLDPLRGVLESESTLKIVHNAAFERGVFARLGYTLANVFDTLLASRETRGRDALGGHSLLAVCERELGFTLDKTVQTSTWARRPLSKEQLAYAVVDVEVLLPLYEVFRGGTS